MDVHDTNGNLMPLTYAALRAKLDADGAETQGPEGLSVTAEIIPGSVAIHSHPASGRPREVHFMICGPDGWQKVAEVGPDTSAPDGAHEDVLPGYLSLIGMWQGRPVVQGEWKARLLHDALLAAHIEGS